MKTKSSLQLSFVFSLMIIFPSLMYCQTDTVQNHKKDVNKNVVSVELLGHGFLYSLNYERLLFNGSRAQTTAQIGFSYYPKKSGVIPLWVPISVNESIRIVNQNYIEFGVGKMLANDGVQMSDTEFINDYKINDWIFRIGYKRFINDQWVIKIAYTPIYQDDIEFIHWGGIGFGYKF
jgi:hypothetical protein